MKELFTVREVAEFTQLHEVTIRRYIRDGKLEAVRIGRNIRVPRAAVEALLAGKTTLREASPIYRTDSSTEMTNMQGQIAGQSREDAIREFDQLLEKIYRDIEEGKISLDDEGDELLKLAGTLSSPSTDIAARHDYYIGEAIKNDDA